MWTAPRFCLVAAVLPADGQYINEVRKDGIQLLRDDTICGAARWLLLTCARYVEKIKCPLMKLCIKLCLVFWCSMLTVLCDFDFGSRLAVSVTRGAQSLLLVVLPWCLPALPGFECPPLATCNVVGRCQLASYGQSYRIEETGELHGSRKERYPKLGMFSHSAFWNRRR